MCEPYHSIIQIDNDNTPGMFLGKLGQWCKKIGNYFHLSKFGKGHHLAMEKIESGKFFATHLDYETHWWDRTTHPDFCTPSQEQRELAHEYAMRTSIGNLHLLRQFLQQSLKISTYPRMYLISARKLFIPKGQLLLEDKLRFVDNKVGRRVGDSHIRCLLGFTRKRNLLVPEWSDDKKLWTPGQ